MNVIEVDLIVMDHAKELYKENLPRLATPGSGAIDLLAAEDAVLYPGQTVGIRTGLRMHMQEPNVAAIVLPRSGLGAKNGLVLGNLVGFIDNDYQGEILCFMWNRNNSMVTQQPMHIQKGMKFAQMAFIPFLTPNFRLLDTQEFSSVTERGTGGFGSTGT